MNIGQCLKDLYQLGIIQGEHNINWSDENNQLENAKNYFDKTRAIADKYGVEYDGCAEDYRENDSEEEYWLWDRMAFSVNEKVRECILESIHDKS